MRGLWIALALVAGPAMAQAPWFGVPTPGPVTAPDAATFQAGPNAYGPAPARGRPKDDVTGALVGDKMMADVRTIVGFSLERKAAGDPLWGRISGLPGEQKTVEWAVARLKALGLKEARVEPYPSEAPLWLPKAWEVRLSTPGAPDVVLKSAVPIRNADTSPK